MLGDEETDWALPCLPFGGPPASGCSSFPESDAQIWVEFEEGEIPRPIWVGTFWQKKGDAPADAKKTTAHDAPAADAGRPHPPVRRRGRQGADPAAPSRRRRARYRRERHPSRSPTRAATRSRSTPTASRSSIAGLERQHPDHVTRAAPMVEDAQRQHDRDGARPASRVGPADRGRREAGHARRRRRRADHQGHELPALSSPPTCIPRPWGSPAAADSAG